MVCQNDGRDAVLLVIAITVRFSRITEIRIRLKSNQFPLGVRFTTVRPSRRLDQETELRNSVAEKKREMWAEGPRQSFSPVLPIHGDLGFPDRIAKCGIAGQSLDEGDWSRRSCSVQP